MCVFPYRVDYLNKIDDILFSDIGPPRRSRSSSPRTSPSDSPSSSQTPADSPRRSRTNSDNRDIIYVFIFTLYTFKEAVLRLNFLVGQFTCLNKSR